MSKSKHTPGPWWIDVDNLATSIESKHFTIATDCNNDDAERIVACVNACEGIADVAAIPECLNGLQAIFDMMDDGALVRNTDHDASPDWAISMVEIMGKLKAAHTALVRAKGDAQ